MKDGIAMRKIPPLAAPIRPHAANRLRMTERGGLVVTVLLTLACVALVCSAAWMTAPAR